MNYSILKKPVIVCIGILFLISISTIVLISCKSVVKSDLLEYYSDRDRTNVTLLDLFYGMSLDSLGNYYDSELDSIDNLLYNEFSAEWKNPKDSTSFIISIGLYIDKFFPNEKARRIMLEKVDSVMTEGMRYDLSENDLISLKSQMYHIPDSIPLFLKLWTYNFDRWAKIYNLNSTDIKYNQILDSRGCVVCHRIYEDERWITYILESSIDYHGSCGCPSGADYITIEKNTGKILSKYDILNDNILQALCEQLPSLYAKAAKEKGFSPNRLCSGICLLQGADGVSLINEGLLVYYQPYNLGCGAEGQYNLIVPLE